MGEIGVRVREQQSAESAWVDIPQRSTIVEDDLDVFMLCGGSSGGHDAHAPRHAEMPDHVAFAGVDQQVLGTALHRFNPGLFQRLNFGWNRPA